MVIFQFATLNYQRVLVLSLKQKNSVQFISNSPKESMRSRARNAGPFQLRNGQAEPGRGTLRAVSSDKSLASAWLPVYDVIL